MKAKEQAAKARKVTTCSVCNEQGHNARGCPKGAKPKKAALAKSKNGGGMVADLLERRIVEIVDRRVRELLGISA